MTAAATLATRSVPPIVQAVVVPQTPDGAFRLFTRDMAAWWPLQQLSAAPNAAGCAVEERVGGRVYEWTAAGAETSWGRIVVWEPGRRFAYLWTVGMAPGQTQEIDVTFTPVANGTRVQVVHADWDGMGEGAQAMRDDYDGGWNFVVDQCFGAYARAAQVQ